MVRNDNNVLCSRKLPSRKHSSERMPRQATFLEWITFTDAILLAFRFHNYAIWLCVVILKKRSLWTSIHACQMSLQPVRQCTFVFSGVNLKDSPKRGMDLASLAGFSASPNPSFKKNFTDNTLFKQVLNIFVVEHFYSVVHLLPLFKDWFFHHWKYTAIVHEILSPYIL